jgi:hypothetical protein
MESGAGAIWSTPTCGVTAANAPATDAAGCAAITALADSAACRGVFGVVRTTTRVCTYTPSQPVAVSAYSCACVLGYAGGMCGYDPIAEYDALCSVETGGNCGLDLDECASNPCQNGAACYDSSDGVVTALSGSVTVPLDAFTCVCQSGYSNGLCDYSALFQYAIPCHKQLGGICDIDVDECISNPCQNRAIRCTSLDDDFLCFCSPGFDGHDCENNIDDCASNPCNPASTAACHDRTANWACQCIPGWGGETCTLDRDECSSS